MQSTKTSARKPRIVRLRAPSQERHSDIRRLPPSRPLAASHPLNLFERHLAMNARQPRRVRLRNQDRIFWAVIARAWSPWRSGLHLVQPETVVRWHLASLLDLPLVLNQKSIGTPADAGALAAPTTIEALVVTLFAPANPAAMNSAPVTVLRALGRYLARVDLGVARRVRRLDPAEVRDVGVVHDVPLLHQRRRRLDVVAIVEVALVAPQNTQP